jgi:ABC-type polysaccharide/polyol phosphate transport system ATPase subunit
MRRRLDGIVAFAELEDFVEAPIRTYSSGMSARLAFAVATDVDPDILLIDEALAVGDERFRIKCEKRMRSFREAGKTILFVSHSVGQVREICKRAIWIHQGSVVQDGDAETVTENYHQWSIAGDPVPPDEFVATRPVSGSGSSSPAVPDSRLAT